MKSTSPKHNGKVKHAPVTFTPNPAARRYKALLLDSAKPLRAKIGILDHEAFSAAVYLWLRATEEQRIAAVMAARESEEK